MNMTIRKVGCVIIITILLVLAAVLGIGLHAAGKATLSRQEKVQYQKQMEKAYVKELRAFLTEQGYHNSGVTMTRTTESDGSFFYKTQIHHQRIDRMEEAEREILLAELSKLPAPMAEAEVFHDFLILNP